ncbi:hypothetical protein niasHS_002088 [Heterodera schachtii]|uniref:Calpain catalytic domain-containing protein n=1 Tax=Heterodera schachtii TaxID=97005 RepID=A0ABD2K5T4_HETSC
MEDGQKSSVMVDFHADMMANCFTVGLRLKKAYANDYGGYKELVDGKVRECMSDLTGGITEEWNLKPLAYIDHSVIAFLRSNKQIWDRSGTNLEFNVNYSSDENESDVQPICDVFTNEIWPVFWTNIRHLIIAGRDFLDNLRRRTSPTLLTDLDQLHSIESGGLFPDGIADD